MNVSCKLSNLQFCIILSKIQNLGKYIGLTDMICRFWRGPGPDGDCHSCSGPGLGPHLPGVPRLHDTGIWAESR